MDRLRCGAALLRKPLGTRQGIRFGRAPVSASTDSIAVETQTILYNIRKSGGSNPTLESGHLKARAQVRSKVQNKEAAAMAAS